MENPKREKPRTEETAEKFTITIRSTILGNGDYNGDLIEAYIFKDDTYLYVCIYIYIYVYIYYREKEMVSYEVGCNFVFHPSYIFTNERE